MSFGVRIKEMREALGLTQGQLAQRLGRTTSAVSDIERGKTKSLPKSAAAMLESLFGVNPSWLYTGSGEMFLTSGALDAAAAANALTEGEINLLRRYMAIPLPLRETAYRDLASLVDACHSPRAPAVPRSAFRSVDDLRDAIQTLINE